MLKHQHEPLAPNKPIEEDDVGLSASDDKIRNMLARYMAEEEDEDILAALQGSTGAGGGGGMGEEDERLSEEERLLLGFQDRVRRVPRQILRYARGGQPLWSIPSTKGNAKGGEEESLWKIPTCTTCGKACTFEMQLVPSLLHVLQVDKFGGENPSGNINDLFATGMNWGSVAVFTCNEPDCSATQGGLIIQKSVDENPEMEEREGMDFTPTMAVVEDMDDDEDFEPYGN